MAGKEPAPEQVNRPTIPTIMVVTHDLKLLKLLDMGLKLELACDVLSFTHTRSVQETAKHVKPDLLILDHQLLNHRTRAFGSPSHSIQGLERVPTILVNVAAASLHEMQSTSTIALATLWQIDALYAAVHKLLDGYSGPL